MYRCIHGTNLFHFHRVVKLTSPTLNCVLLLGLAIFVSGPLHYPSTSAIVHSIRCVVRMKWNAKILRWLYIYIHILFYLQINPIFSSLGYNTVIAVALVKTCRVHYIFKKPSPNKRVMLYSYTVACLKWMQHLIIVTTISVNNNLLSYALKSINFALLHD